MIGLPELIAGIIVVALNAYVLMGGADFGGGVWDLFATGPRREQQRALISESIAPIWEANHVWLIVVVVMLFTAFPVAFNQLGTVLHIPLTIMLVGIVLRGTAFVFRNYGAQRGVARARWGIVFAVASTITPIVLGMTIGAIAGGRAAAAYSAIGTGTFADVYVRPWLGPFPIAIGCLAIALFAFLAAAYLAYAAADGAVRDDFRRRGLIAAAFVFLFAFLALAIAFARAPIVARGLTESGWALAVHVVTAIAAVSAIWALWTRRYAVARIAAAAQVTFILWGWVVAQYPYLLPASLTIRGSAAPAITLELLLIGVIAGGLVLIPSLRYLLRNFTP